MSESKAEPQISCNILQGLYGLCSISTPSYTSEVQRDTVTACISSPVVLPGIRQKCSCLISPIGLYCQHWQKSPCCMLTSLNAAQTGLRVHLVRMLPELTRGYPALTPYRCNSESQRDSTRLLRCIPGAEHLRQMQRRRTKTHNEKVA